MAMTRRSRVYSLAERLLLPQSTVPTVLAPTLSSISWSLVAVALRLLLRTSYLDKPSALCNLTLVKKALLTSTV